METAKPAPNTARTGPLGLGAFFELVLNYCSFPFLVLFSPAAANANRWVAALLIGHRIRSYLTSYQEERIENVVH